MLNRFIPPATLLLFVFFIVIMALPDPSKPSRPSPIVEAYKMVDSMQKRKTDKFQATLLESPDAEHTAIRLDGKNMSFTCMVQKNLPDAPANFLAPNLNSQLGNEVVKRSRYHFRINSTSTPKTGIACTVDTGDFSPEAVRYVEFRSEIPPAESDEATDNGGLG